MLLLIHVSTMNNRYYIAEGCGYIPRRHDVILQRGVAYNWCNEYKIFVNE